MNKNIFLLILLCFTLNVKAQSDFSNAFLNFGYKIGTGKFAALDGVLNRYNASLGNKLKAGFDERNFPAGYAAALGGYYGNVFAQVGYNQAQLKQSATYLSADSAGVSMKRNIRLTTNSLYIGAGIGGPLSNKLIIGVGGNVEFGTMVAKTRNGTESKVKDESWNRVLREKTTLTTVFLHFIIGEHEENSSKLHIEPYFTFAHNKPDLAPLERAINPTSSGGDTRLSMNHFGLKLALSTYINFY